MRSLPEAVTSHKGKPEQHSCDSDAAKTCAKTSLKSHSVYNNPRRLSMTSSRNMIRIRIAARLRMRRRSWRRN